jgi:tetratricopeptide (TPR) repeat protein
MPTSVPAALAFALGSMIWLAQPARPAARDSDRLAMAAHASGRPKECKGSADARGISRRLTIWDRAREPDLHRYCDLIGRAYVKLDAKPAAAREAALLADQVLPGKAAPWVIIGRADVHLRDFTRAVEDFQKAKAIDPRSAEDPTALHDLAVALRMTGKPKIALETYRVLVPRLGLIPSTDARVLILLEAASLAMSTGKEGIDESISFLSEARSLPLSQHDALVLALFGLALDRSGLTQESSAIADEMDRSGASSRIASSAPSSFSFLAASSDGLALIAFALERSDPPRAAEMWERYANTQPAPTYAEHAKARRLAVVSAHQARRAPTRRGP